MSSLLLFQSTQQGASFQTKKIWMVKGWDLSKSREKNISGWFCLPLLGVRGSQPQGWSVTDKKQTFQPKEQLRDTHKRGPTFTHCLQMPHLFTRTEVLSLPAMTWGYQSPRGWDPLGSVWCRHIDTSRQVRRGPSSQPGVSVCPQHPQRPRTLPTALPRLCWLE